MATKISFIKASPLTNVRGRVDYISNPKRQENLIAFYQTPEDPAAFWKTLSDTTRANTAYHKNADKHVEAREHVVMLPYDLADEDPYELAKEFAEDFKKQHGVECAVGIHWNKKKSNFHLHLVFSERQLLQEREASIATRNTYFDVEGKRSTKGKCVGADGKLLPGCRMVQKGEAFPSKTFAGKDGKFFTYSFIKSEKERYAKLFSERTNDEWIVYNQLTNPHMSLLNLVNGEPAGLRAWKERENDKRKEFNATIDRMIDSGELTVEQALEIKKLVYVNQIEQRKERAAEREAWKTWFEASEERKKAWRIQKETEWEKLHFNSLGLRRSSLELLVILGLTIVGFDVLKVDIDEELIARPPASQPKAEIDPKLTAMIDAMCIAAGRKAPSEILAERQVQRMAEQGRHTSLFEQMQAAERRKKDENRERAPGEFPER